jgi:hypothetical protein
MEKLGRYYLAVLCFVDRLAGERYSKVLATIAGAGGYYDFEDARLYSVLTGGGY